MGQRHQVYVRLPKKYYNKGNPNNRDEVTIGIHHQWLYGQTAGKLLKNFLTFIKNQDEYGPFTEKGLSIYQAMDALQALYSLDIKSGYYHSTSPLWDYDKNNNERIGVPGKETLNPMLGDNNDGITVIDLTGEKPRYCMMSLYGIECDESMREEIPELTPINYEKGLRSYYPDYETDNDTKNKKFNDESKKIVKFMKKYELLTLADIKRIFPKLEIPPQSVQYLKELKNDSSI